MPLKNVPNRGPGRRFEAGCTIAVSALLFGLSMGLVESVSAQTTANQVTGSEHLSKAVRPDSPAPQQRPQRNHYKEPVPPRRLSLSERWDFYLHSIKSPNTVAGPAFGALVNQANDDPPEWGQGAAGYARRFGSGYGRMLITRTLRFGIAAADHEDPLFHPSSEHGIWRRARYATIHYFVVQSDGGGPMPAFSRFGSVYGAAFISNAWYPSSHATTQHALLRGTTALGASVGWNLFREFWPDIKNALHGNK